MKWKKNKKLFIGFISGVLVASAVFAVVEYTKNADSLQVANESGSRGLASASTGLFGQDELVTACGMNQRPIVRNEIWKFGGVKKQQLFKILENEAERLEELTKQIVAQCQSKGKARNVAKVTDAYTLLVLAPVDRYVSFISFIKPQQKTKRAKSELQDFLQRFESIQSGYHLKKLGY